MPDISAAVDDFFREFQFPDESRNTKRTYETALRKFCEYAKETGFASSEIKTLEPSVISRFGGWLVHAGLSESTQNIYEAALRRAINYWRVKGWIVFSSDDEKDVRQAMRIQSKRRNAYRGNRVGRVPEDFGDRMLKAAKAAPLPEASNRLGRLNVLRARALIHVLRATGLRIGDICRLPKSVLTEVYAHDGYFTLQMQKTGSLAHCMLGRSAMEAVQAYLQERSDPSPWVFIQHGRAGKLRTGTVQFFRMARKGYGARISTKTAWEIVRRVAKDAYGNTDGYLSPHAFRHWHAQSLIRAGARLEDVQSVLGHANPVITKQIYAPEPDLSRISEKERMIQGEDKEI